MYAVIKTGGKQYRVAQGDRLRVEKLAGNVGDTVSLGEVLLVGQGDGVKVGAPLVSGAKVEAKIIAQDRGKKITIFKFRRRTRGLEYAQAHRVFLRAPLHHHFEVKGWKETQVVVRFWIIGILCAFVAFSTLKLR